MYSVHYRSTALLKMLHSMRSVVGSFYAPRYVLVGLVGLD
jgi:hypothetical protein